MGNPKANGENRRDKKRIDGRFFALPIDTLQSAAYRSLSHTARSLLIDIASQYMGENNGRLRASMKSLRALGWKSADVVARAKKELLQAELIYETVMGCRPNKASWYAVTWADLDMHPGFDPDVHRGFKRGAYRTAEIRPVSPPRGAARQEIAPSDGKMKVRPAPSGGAIRPRSTNTLVRLTDTI